MSKDNIIGKIRKLLAIADKNSGASENEMMTAMAMAQALMRRHHLSPVRVRRRSSQQQCVHVACARSALARLARPPSSQSSKGGFVNGLLLRFPHRR